MSEFDAIRSVLNRPTFQDEDEMEIIASEINSVATALQMLLDQVEMLQAEVTQLKLNHPEEN